MEVLHLHEVDSTSTYAAGLLAQGKRAPFLVHADTQTGGRGRRGHAWVSPNGNLFITIALPAEQTPPAFNGLLPLKAGVVLAQLLQEITGLRVTLKWPNDLLFGGRKLGGLLLESSVSGGQFGDLLIGIGLNCAHAPQLPGAYAATCLDDLLGRPVAAAALVRVIAAGFADAWRRLPIDAVLAAYADFAIAPGHVYGHAEAGLATCAGLSDDGGLRLTKADGTQLALTSADHGWRWLHQGSGDQVAPLLVADVGNSAIKVACFERQAATLPERLERWSYDQPESALVAALQRIWPQRGGLPWPLFIASVRPSAAAQLSAVASSLGLAPHQLPKRALRCIGKGYKLSEIGLDRLAGVEAWLDALTPTQRATPGGYGLVVQAGTATTIDAVRTNGEHLGGLILPGLMLAVSSLHQAAALLPALENAAALRAHVCGGAVLGHDTRSAMSCAAVTMSLGAVERVIHQLAAKSSLELIDVVVSGGWAELLAPELRARSDASLVLKGARCMALGGLFAPSPA